MKPHFAMPEILMPAEVSAHTDLVAIRLLAASDTAGEIKLGVLRQILFRHRINRFSLDALAVAYRGKDLRLRAAILASICSALDRWGFDSSVLVSCQYFDLVSAIQNEGAVVLWPWCLLARAALKDERLVLDLEALKKRTKYGRFNSSQSAHESAEIGESNDKAVFKAIATAIGRIENQKPLLAFCY